MIGEIPCPNEVNAFGLYINPRCCQYQKVIDTHVFTDAKLEKIIGKLVGRSRCDLRPEYIGVVCKQMSDIYNSLTGETGDHTAFFREQVALLI